MVTRRSMIALGGATALAVSTGHMTGDAKKKKKSKVVTRTFSNANGITTDGSDQATPYPSTIQVSGLKKGKIQKMRVFLNGYSAPVPDNIDVMLSASQLPGLTAVIMSDVGAAVAVSNLNLVLDDEAATSMPDEAVPPFTSGTYKPTDHAGGGGADSFPAPAPTPNGNSALSMFNGANPNGTWQLWVDDDPGNGPAQFAGGWGIEITAKVKKKKKKK